MSEDVKLLADSTPWVHPMDVLASLTSSTSYSFETRHLWRLHSFSSHRMFVPNIGEQDFFLVEVVDFTHLPSNLT